MPINDTIILDQKDIDRIGDHFNTEIFQTLDGIELGEDYKGPQPGEVAAEIEALLRKRLAEMMAG